MGAPPMMVRTFTLPSNAPTSDDCCVSPSKKPLNRNRELSNWSNAQATFSICLVRSAIRSR